jgi:hypothetical protein
MSQQETNVKAFVTSANTEESAPAGEPITVSVDGREITFNAPDINQVVLLTAAMEGASTDAGLAATMLNAFMYMIDTDRDAAHIRGRLFNSRDKFDLGNVSEIMAYLLETWSNRPTGSSSDASPSRSNGGKKSKARRHGHGSPSGTATSPNGAH